MKSIFADKELLKKEYQRLFLERVSDLSILKKSIKCRYDNEPTESEIQAFFKKGDLSLNEFLKAKNEERIRHFFGTFDNEHDYDAQLSLLDRFILDSVHFDIISKFILMMEEEYSNNLIEIINEWSQVETLIGIEPKFLIYKEISQNKSLFYSDLNFPEHGMVQLFKLRKGRIEPNAEVFAQWLPPSNSFIPKIKKYSNSLLIGMSGAALGALCGVYFGIVGAAVGAIIGLTLAVGVQIAVYFIQRLRAESVKVEIIDERQRPSFSLMNELMPAHVNKVVKGNTSEQSFSLGDSVRAPSSALADGFSRRAGDGIKDPLICLSAPSP